MKKGTDNSVYLYRPQKKLKREEELKKNVLIVLDSSSGDDESQSHSQLSPPNVECAAVILSGTGKTAVDNYKMPNAAKPEIWQPGEFCEVRSEHALQHTQCGSFQDTDTLPRKRAHTPQHPSPLLELNDSFVMKRFGSMKKGA